MTEIIESNDIDSAKVLFKKKHRTLNLLEIKEYINKSKNI